LYRKTDEGGLGNRHYYRNYWRRNTFWLFCASPFKLHVFWPRDISEIGVKITEIRCVRPENWMGN